MAATGTASTIRYAPEDPTLPKPWKGLVDSKTGYLYFWNPETNVTQYERPVGPTPPSKPSSASISSSIRVQKSSYEQPSDNGPDKEIDDGSRFSVNAKSGSSQSNNAPSGSSSAAFGGSAVNGLAASAAGNGLSAEAYRRRHEITVTGDQVPQPLISFEAADFPPEILREVRYFAPGRS